MLSSRDIDNFNQVFAIEQQERVESELLELPVTLKRSKELNKYCVAIALSKVHLKADIDLKNPKHLSSLQAALSVQDDPETWRSFNKDTQMAIKDMLRVKYNYLTKDDEFRTYTSSVFDIIMDLSEQHIPLVKPLRQTADLIFRDAEIVKGYGSREIRGLSKIPHAQFLLDKDFPITQEGINYILAVETSRKCDSTTILKKFNISVKDVSPEIMKKLDEFITEYKVKQFYNEKIKEQKRKTQQCFKDAEDFGASVANLGKIQKNSSILSFGRMIQSTTAICSNAVRLSSMASSGMALTGMSLLLPGANLAIAAASLLMGMSSDTDDDKLQEVLLQISHQIDSLKNEMNTRFNLLDAQLVKVFATLIARCSNLKNIIISEIGYLKYSLAVFFQQHTNDVSFILSAIDKGILTVRTDSFKEKLSTLKSYVSGNSAELEDAKNYIVRTTDSIETDWLIPGAKLLDEMGNSTWYLQLEDKKEIDLANISNLSETLAIKSPEIFLSFLTRFARFKLNIQHLPYELPNLNLFEHGLKICLAARMCLLQHHHYDRFDRSLLQLNSIKKVPLAIIDSMDKLEKNRIEIFEKLISMYIKTLKSFEKEVLKIISKKYQAEVAGQTKLITTLDSKIHCLEEKTLPELDSGHLIKVLKESKIRFPTVLVDAEEASFSVFDLKYQGVRTEPEAKDDPLHDNWTYYTSRIPAMPIYQILILDVCKIELKTVLKIEKFQITNKRDCLAEKQTHAPYVSQQKAISASALFGGNWGNSTLLKFEYNSELKAFVEKRTPELAARIIEQKYLNAKNQNPQSIAFLRRFIQDEKVSLSKFEKECRALQALMLGYAKMLNMPPSFFVNIFDSIKCVSLESFCSDLTLFDKQYIAAAKMIKTLLILKPSTISPIKEKALAMVERIESFEYVHHMHVKCFMGSEVKASKHPVRLFSHSELPSEPSVTAAPKRLISKL